MDKGMWDDLPVYPCRSAPLFTSHSVSFYLSNSCLFVFFSFLSGIFRMLSGVWVLANCKVAFSLCSNRTKNLVKPLHKKRGNIFAEVRESGISLDIRLWTYQGYQSLVLLLNSSSSLVKLEQGNKCWRKQGFTQSDWVAHFMNIFDKYEIQKLQINNASLCHLDTVKQIIPKCQIILIREQCSAELTKTAFLKLAPIAKKVQINNNPFDSENDISELLTLNLKSVSFIASQNSFELKLDDLLLSNIINLYITTVNITGKELKRFLKVWIKSSHRFYRPKFIKLRLSDEMEISHVEVLKGIKYEIVRCNTCAFRLKRSDGKELTVFFITRQLIDFTFE
ncbi:Protein CBG22652 [Caenorhabditis briggsae]|uniref:Protein CBG22652 n=1 Tax=Caenorhabditis briggsae TaxID=6238 RepID=A8Y2S4_CAEBR|nr:Protein CBG22652 [Caenorhabditis briggsae]CAP39199.1 Protein CBG22652 [Caenorhabditis briggsae]